MIFFVILGALIGGFLSYLLFCDQGDTIDIRNCNGFSFSVGELKIFLGALFGMTIVLMI